MVGTSPTTCSLDNFPLSLILSFLCSQQIRCSWEAGVLFSPNRTTRQHPLRVQIVALEIPFPSLPSSLHYTCILSTLPRIPRHIISFRSGPVVWYLSYVTQKAFCSWISRLAGCLHLGLLGWMKQTVAMDGDPQQTANELKYEGSQRHLGRSYLFICIEGSSQFASTRDS